MKNIKISICIPTYNRSQQLNSLLINLASEIGNEREKFEIVIIDNASTDDTNEIIFKHINKGLPIKYIRRSSNTGLVYNIGHSIDFCEGYYTHLMGDDDVFRGGFLQALEAIVDSLEPDVMVADRIVCDKDLKPISVEKAADFSQITAFDGGNEKNLNLYFGNTISMIGIFSFISSITIKTAKWKNCNHYPEMYLNIFPHAIKVMDILTRQQGRLVYYPEPIVFARMDNSRSIEWAGPTKFELWDSHFRGLSNVCDIFYYDKPDMYQSFMTPISKIISRGLQDYLDLAAKDGFYAEATKLAKRLRLIN